jgi:[ribosomal protein S5]-alanine N-acetyltransferase
MTYKYFETERLWIRPTTIHDSEFILELMNTPKWIEFIGDRNLHTVKDAEQYIKNKMLPQLERLGFSNYTLIRKLDEVKVGCCGLYDREGVEGVDIGFAFLPAFENQGYGFESANRLIQAAKNDFGLKAVSAITSKNNFASQKLIEKLNLKLVGTTILPNEIEEILLYRVNF